MRSKSTHLYCEECFCPLLHESIRRSIINAEAGGARKRNNIVTTTDQVTKPTVIVNKPAMIRRIRLLDMPRMYELSLPIDNKSYSIYRKGGSVSIGTRTGLILRVAEEYLRVQCFTT